MRGIGATLALSWPERCYRSNWDSIILHSWQSVRAELIDDQAADLIRSIHLPDNWEPIVRQMLHVQRDQVDPEAERKHIRGMLRLMRENFERGLYEGEEYQYW